MTQRIKLELELNKTTEIELMFDEPITGESKYGNYYLYAVKSGDSEFSYFPTDEVHNQLKDLKKGDKALITKLAKQQGNKIIQYFNIETLSKSQSSVQTAVEEMPSRDDSNDKLYDIMLKSYRDALKIQQELSGLADPSRIAITLFIARSKSPYSI